MYGICLLTVIPMRKLSSHKSEMINQVLFGETFKILKQKEWSFINLSHDNYTGWVNNNQYKIIDGKNIKYEISNKLNCRVKVNNIKQQLVLGSLIPVNKSLRKNLKIDFNLNFSVSSKEISLQKIAKKIFKHTLFMGRRSQLELTALVSFKWFLDSLTSTYQEMLTNKQKKEKNKF